MSSKVTIRVDSKQPSVPPPVLSQAAVSLVPPPMLSQAYIESRLPLHHAASSASAARVGASARLITTAYGVQRRGQRISVQRMSSEQLVEDVDVPPEIFDVLANNMPRLLQLISHWSKRTGEVTVEQFERVLHTLGVRYSAEQVSKLFRVLDADANGKVRLDEIKPKPLSSELRPPSASPRPHPRPSPSPKPEPELDPEPEP